MTTINNKKCGLCQTDFKPKFGHNKNTYCSLNCYWSSLKNKKISKEVKEKISKKLKGRISPMLGKGYKMPESRKIKISKALSGKNRPKGEMASNWRGGQVKLNCFNCDKLITKAKSNLKKNNFCSKNCWYTSGLFKKGKENARWKGGRVLTQEQKQRKEKILRTGRNWRYVEDRTLLKKSEKKHLDLQYRDWSINVKIRDGWKCMINNNDCRGRLESHHILNWIDHPELRYEINNGICLCQFHHPRGRNKEKRLESYFMELVSVSKN